MLLNVIFQDQPFFGVTYEVNVTTDSQLNTNPAFLAQSTSQYLTNQTGALTNLGGNFIGKSCRTVVKNSSGLIL